MIVPPERVLPSFFAAGWQHDRGVPVPDYIPVTHSAWQVLRQFGGLHFGGCKRGFECATSDVAFRPEPRDELDDEIMDWEGLLRTTLVSLADVHLGHGELFIDESSRCFVRSYIDDSFSLAGLTFERAIENLLTGVRCRPLLRPDQEQVMLYGRAFTQSSPETYLY